MSVARQTIFWVRTSIGPLDQCRLVKVRRRCLSDIEVGLGASSIAWWRSISSRVAAARASWTARPET